MIRRILFTLFPIVAIAFLSSNSMSDNGKAGRTGSPGENSCTNSCHSSFALNSGPGSITIQSSGMTNNKYVPGQTYSMSVTVTQNGVNLFGIGLEALKSSDTSNAGTLTITDAASTQIKTVTVLAKSRRNIVHTLNGGASPNSKVFNFSWTAPVAGTGDVIFYFAGNAADGDGGEAGDYIYTGSQLFMEDCAPPSQPANISGNSVLCANESATYSVPAVSGATSYSWALPSGWTGTSSTNSITASAGISGDIQVVASNSCGNSLPVSYFVSVNPLPTPSINYISDTLFTSTGSNYQWFLNGNPIPGANNYFHIPAANGNYSVQFTDPNSGCSGISADYLISTVGLVSLFQKSDINVFPSPAYNKMNVTVPELYTNSSLTIYNIRGESVYHSTIANTENIIDISRFAEGTYTLVVQKGNLQVVKKAVVRKN